jgi:hypothetical protein
VGTSGFSKKSILTDGRSNVLTREPLSKAPDVPPASVLQEFTDRAEALTALDRLSLHHSPPGCRRKRDKAGAGQGELQLGPFQTKAEYRLEMLGRRLELGRHG